MIMRSRIIPADAGSTLVTAGGESTKKDHPRGCGEHTDKFCTFHAW